jgi:hypothetical protein
MTAKSKSFAWPSLFGFERRGDRLASHYVFVQRLAINLGIGLVLIGVSLAVGMVSYHQLEQLDWLRSFSHAAMILGGMGPYDEPKSDGGALFEGFYALYSGLLLVGVSGLILAPVFHRVMHQFHLPDETDPDPKPKGKPPSKRSGAK